MRTIYLDYNATTRLDPGVRAAMAPFLDEIYGNPSSVHHVGRQARALLDDARERVAGVWHCKPSEVVFTSGGTESNNLAIFGTVRKLRDKGRHLIISPVEHHAVLHPCEYLERREGFDVTRLPVDSFGRVDPADLARAIKPDTILVSVMAANNEVGTLQPVAELARICRERGVLFHTDAVQWFGKEPVDSINHFEADMVSVCAHKFHGPKGAGALYVRSPWLPDPIVFGGGHENERRAGTENVAGVMGLVAALERFVSPPVFKGDVLRPLVGRLRACAEAIPGVTIHTPEAGCLNNTLAVSVEGADSIGLLAGLDVEGICALIGSACSAGSVEPSHVLTAMGVPRNRANALLRFSLGRETTEEEIEMVTNVLPKVIARIRGV